jgi:hypothetical protein
MSDFERKHDTLLKIVRNSTIRLACPQCLKGFPRSDKLYSHFRCEPDDIHKGLALQHKDFENFVKSYQEALRSLIPTTQIPSDWRAFTIDFIIEHYANRVIIEVYDDDSCDSPAVNLATDPDCEPQSHKFFI